MESTTSTGVSSANGKPIPEPTTPVDVMRLLNPPIPSG